MIYLQNVLGMIHKLLVQIRSNMGIFYKLCEDIAKLDMLQSLAKASSVLYYVRPEFAEYLEVIEARHPMLDFLCSKEPSANSMHASKEYNINIITGPNGSGKSIFVRQVILIQVMAQVGCYVPAQSATLRASDRILARVYLEDNMDCGASAFVLEMKEMQYFHAVLTPNTLIIIDELCRSTSVEEGTALAMGMCEKLMKTSAFVYFTTHFKFLCKLQDLHCNVKTWQLETLTEIIDNQIVLRFTYNVISGVTALEHYGIFLAKGSWPEIIIKYAEDILKKISSADKRPQPHVEPVNAAARLKYDLEADLQSLKAKKQLTRAKINEKLQKYQHDLESLGYQGHHMLASDRINENYDNHYDTVSVTDESSINFLNESAQIRDYFNLQSQQSQSDDMSDISQGINHTMLNPMMDHSSTNMQNKNVFENLLYGHKNTPQFFNFGNANQEMENNSVFPEEFRFPSNQNNSRLDLSNDGTIISGYEYPENTFNFSHSNIFEPEVILQSHENLPFPSAFHLLNSSTISAENTAFIKHDNFCMTVHQKYSYTANENSFRPNFDGSMVYKDNLTFSNNNSSVYGDRENNNKLRNNYFLQHNDESFLSVNEQQFSVPLQQHTERTSTPEIPVLQGQSMWYHQSNMNLPNLQAPKSRNIEDCNLKQIQLNYTSPDEGRFNKTPITNKKEQEATMSDIIQWGPGLFPSPAVFRTPISNSNHCVSNVSQAFPKIDSLYEDNDDTKELEPKSDSIKWGPRLYLPPTQFKTPEINNASKLNKSQASSKTNSLYGDIGSQIDLKKPEPKSDSTKSNSTKWGPGLFASPAVFRTPKSINQSVSNGSNLNISQAFPKTDSLYEDNDDKKELEPKSDSSKRGPRLYPSPFLFRTPEINNNASKLNKSQTSSKTNSLYGDIGSQIDLKKQEPKSDSTKSDSTKWGPGLFASPAVFRTPKSINQSVSNGSNLNISQASPKTDSLYEDNGMRRSIKTPISDKKKQEPKSDSSKSDSIKWGLGLCPSPTVFRTPKSINQSVLNGSNLNTSQASTTTTNSLYGDIGTGQINFKDSGSNNNLLQKPVNINSKQQFSSRGSVTPKNMTCKSQAGVNKSDNFDECTSKQIKSISSSSHSHDEDWRRITTPIGNEKGQVSKSDSTKSDSIKWTAPLLPSPNLSSKLNTTGATPNRTNKSDAVGGTNKHNNTSILCNPNNYYSQANITEIINDLESCSEYFSDSHDWDFVDEGVKSKPVQLSDTERSKTLNQKVDPSKPAPTNENHQQLEEKLENDAELQSHENIYSGQSSEMEYHTPLKISTIAEIHEPPSRQRKSNIEKVSQIKSKIPKNGDAPQTNFHNEMDQIQYATEYQPQYYKNALSKIQEHELISSGNNKTMANTRTENYSNLNKNQSSNVGKKDSVKNQNEINSQQCQKGDVGLKSISLHDISLEPLGDIHLELFSDESQIDAKEENVVLNESSGCYINATATNDQCKVQVDCTVSKNVHLSTDEYDTAQSMIVSSQQDTIHFNTPTSFFDPEFTSTPLDKSPQIGKKFSPKLKRRKLGLTTRKVDKVKTEIPTKPIFNRKTSPEVAGSSQLDVEMSHTPSDFESSVSKKSLLLQKVRQQNSAKKPKISKTKPMKFKPPKQLTKKQVEEEFYEQDKKLMESGDESQYLEHIMNRPSFKQLQEIKQIASFHRTSSGVVVVPAKDKKPKTRKRKFVPPLLKKTSVPFDLTIFADKNSSKYEEFMNNNNTKNAIHVRVDVAPFQAIESQVVSKTDINEHTAAKNKINILQNITLVPPDQQTESTPKEYYSTPSTNRIDNIVEKYLKPQVEVSSESKIFERFNSSVFSKSTLVLDLDDSL